jgi:hypothetical protein
MSVYVGHKAFAGPYRSHNQIRDRAGVYAVLSKSGRVPRVRRLGQSANLQTTVRQSLVTALEADEALEVAVLYTPGIRRYGRVRLLEEIKDNLTLSIGYTS